ncbi:hypothetical protein Cme02nite_65860 [Catellatospora methionotrophica]|uniref:Uncharacterized protein n=1 Tax=Catellatospora methionotrophica TaxID=121620 RepID=A0A8J3LG76_9ACTN|nr:hypothetical protein [Catellatospora methionotrophica]GIG18254.1 hypothetical protein Cme02nite_65860 [Catellatospora methionotrophica]
MWRFWYALGVALAGFGLLIGTLAVYGYTQLVAEQARVERLLSEAEGEAELRMRQVQVGGIEDDRSNNILVAVGSLVPITGGVALVALSRRRLRERRAG